MNHTLVSHSLKVLLNLLALVLNGASQVSQHFFVETYHSVTIHVVLNLLALLRTHMEWAISLLGQVALPQSLLRAAYIIRGLLVPFIRVKAPLWVVFDVGVQISAWRFRRRFSHPQRWTPISVVNIWVVASLLSDCMLHLVGKFGATGEGHWLLVLIIGHTNMSQIASFGPISVHLNWTCASSVRVGGSWAW